MSQAGGLTMASLVTTRLEAVFIISTTTVGRLSEAFPRWHVLAGYVIGLTLLLVPVPNVLLTWVFPIWVATNQRDPAHPARRHQGRIGTSELSARTPPHACSTPIAGSACTTSNPAGSSVD